MKDLEDYQSVRGFVTIWSITMRIVRTLAGAVALYFGATEARAGNLIGAGILIAIGGWLLFVGVRSLRAGGFIRP